MKIQQHNSTGSTDTGGSNEECLSWDCNYRTTVIPLRQVSKCRI